ncbi:MAG: hypothetical protein ACXW4E_00710, partial [Anaerolineales bacterium]
MSVDARRDRLWIGLVSALILFWGSIPTWAGYQAQTRELRFRGTYYDPQDYAVHIGAMEAGRQGEWAYQFRFTTEPHNPAYIRLFYLVLGHFSRWFGINSEYAFQLARWILGLMALFALYKLMGQIFPDRFWARVAFLLATLGSGLGWLQLIFNWTSTRITPIDFWLVDDYVFFSLSVFPHFAFVTTAMCLALGLWLDFLKRPRWKKIPSIALLAIFVQFVNPIAFATVDLGILGAALFLWLEIRKIRREDLLALVTIALSQIPVLTYNYFVLSNDPLWNQFTAQNQTLSPPPDYYLWGFALFWPLALLGIVTAFRTKSHVLGASLFWVINAFILAYSPVFIQRRFLQNITIPLGILATAGLTTLFEWGTKRSPGLLRWRSGLIILFIFLLSLSSIQISLGQAAYLQTHPGSLYYPASLEEAISWFDKNAQYNDFVLASEQTSQILVQKARLRAYFGHEMETLNYQDKKKRA